MAKKDLELPEEKQKPIEEQLADAMNALQEAEAKIADLLAQIDTLQSELNTVKEQNFALQEAESANADYKALMETLEAENLALKKAVTAPANQAPATSVASLPPFTYEDIQYKFICRQFTLPNGSKITAEDALSDENILAQLVKMGSGVITKI
jgi:hypothetical protein